MIMAGPAAVSMRGGRRLAVVVTVAKGCDLAYIWKNQPGISPADASITNAV
jgi:hypothetical protein